MDRASIQSVRLALRNGAYRLTQHAEREREVDAISMREIEEALGSEALELLEDYPDDPRGSSGLFLGFTTDGNPLHAVVGLSSPDHVVLVTIYRPRAALWYDWPRRV